MSAQQPIPGAAALAGRAILVTRPAAQAEPLCRLILGAGGEALRCPALEIQPPRDPARAAALLSADALARLDWIIFISPTAVNAAFSPGHSTLLQGLPAGLRVAAVGQGTARSLRARGVPQVQVPDAGADAAALAALPQLAQLNAQRVLIVRGEGGRDWLGDTLRARGAAVDYAECYRRALPAPPAEFMQSLSARWQAGGVHAACVTSRQALDNLLRMFDAIAARVRATPLFAAHERVGQHARERGFAQVSVCQPGDAAMLAALRDFFAGS